MRTKPCWSLSLHCMFPCCHLHLGLSCSQIPVHSVTHLVVVAVAAAAGAWCSETRRNISFRCLSIHPRSLRSTLLTGVPGTGGNPSLRLQPSFPGPGGYPSPRLQPPFPSPLSALPGLGQPCAPWLPGSIPTAPLRAASRQLRHHAEGHRPLKTSGPLGSASRTSSLNKPSQSIPELSHFYHKHTYGDVRFYLLVAFVSRHTNPFDDA